MDEALQLGCMECGSIFNVEDIYGGGCPVCEAQSITTFEDLLAYVREHRQFMEQLGLGDDD